MQFLLNGHEFNLKGGNRGFFTTRLRDNVEQLLAGCGCRVGMQGLGLAVDCPGEESERVRQRLQRALGVQTMVAGEGVEASLEAIAPAALAAIAAQEGASFGLEVQRPDKALGLSSHEVAVAVGRHIQEQLGLAVDLRHPARRCTIVLSRRGALVSRGSEAGPGGMPAGTAGRLLGLLSSGYDSPVAAFRLMRRGARVGLLHFYATPPAGQGSSVGPVEALARQLTRYQIHTRLYICPFLGVQQAIVANAPSRLRVLLYRRFMLRIGVALAERVHAHGLITGDSLGQVASQTVLNLEAVSAAAAVAVYRPLIGDDKHAIQAEARRIGTYAASSELSEDCCSAFMPRSPALASTAAELAEAERGLAVEELVAAALAGIQTKRFALHEGEPAEE
ncbi:MAG: tRNA sulfurtransferase [Terriglobales bacterium]